MENNLEIDVKNAKKLGLSYGYYKALHYHPEATKPVDPKTTAQKASGDKTCPVCGEIVKPPRITYCCKECMYQRNNENKRLTSRERYLSKVKCFEKEGD